MADTNALLHGRFPHGLARILVPALLLLCWTLSSCSAVRTSYDLGAGTLSAAYKATELTAKAAAGTCTAVYRVGGFTFRVAMAPLHWPLVREEIESIGGMPPKKAIHRGEVKNAPYVVNGRRYEPMSVREARSYRRIGTASWYGQETLQQEGGHMTANGEVFDPGKLTAAHKHLPLPTYARVTNLENNRSIVVRVNDRGPFVRGRIIDLSAGAAKRLGFHSSGTARVLVETVSASS
jgi:rare lipoprotein A